MGYRNIHDKIAKKAALDDSNKRIKGPIQWWEEVENAKPSKKGAYSSHWDGIHVGNFKSPQEGYAAAVEGGNDRGHDTKIEIKHKGKVMHRDYSSDYK